MTLWRQSAVVATAAAAVLLPGVLVVPAASAQRASALPKITSACNQDVAPGQVACLAMETAGMTPLGVVSGFGPADIQSAYHLPSGSAGTGQTVWIVDAYDNPNAEAELAVYRDQFGLPPCTTANGCFAKLDQGGGTAYPSANSGWAAEISLDLAMVSATCPNCSIRLIESINAYSSNLFKAIQTALGLGAKFLSLSWGGPEMGGEATYDRYFNKPGVVFTAASGDYGYSDGVLYPSTSPYVVAVGGTSLHGSPGTGWSETAWSGAGSGCSAYAAKPPWQAAVANAVCPRRASADVSAVADPNTGVAVYYNGGWRVFGGTSASAPIIASVYALAGPPGASDRAARYLYEGSGGLNDVTSGSTGSCSPAALCTATAGWDGPTGLGTPNGLGAFSGGGGGVTVKNPGSRSATVGVPVSLQVSAVDTNVLPLTYSASGLPTGLSINAATGRIGGTPIAGGTFTATVTARDAANVSGSASFTWTVVRPICTGQILSNGGFESGLAPWSATAGVLHVDRYARNGRRYANLDGFGRPHIDTLTRRVAIRGGCDAAFTFALRVASADGSRHAHDTLTLYLNGRAVTRFSNLNRSALYHYYRLNLSAYAGTTVTVTWRGVEDASVRTSFQLDNLGVTLSYRR